MNLSLYLWQRGTAALMAPMVIVHLVVIFYAARHGLTAADILGRVRGSLGWGSFYALFVAAASSMPESASATFSASGRRLQNAPPASPRRRSHSYSSASACAQSRR